MFRNFLLVATRNFLRQRFYSFINVFGLATGLASALLILLWVNDEVNVDAGYNDSHRLYRVISNLDIANGEILTWNITPGPLGEAITQSVPEVELAVRTMDNGSSLLRYQDKSFLERGMYADSTFFALFDFAILRGSTDRLDRSSIAISEKMATNLFGKEEPIGKIVRVANAHDLEVRAVFANAEKGTSMRFEYILPFDIYRRQRGDGFNWGNYDHPLYLKLHEGASPDDAIAKINAMENERVKGMAENAESQVNFLLVPLKDYYLNSNYVNGVPEGGRIVYVRVFSIVAVFVVLIACINFMNMATARAVQRAKEVGIRKVVGAQRVSLMAQFMGESVATTFVSMVAGLGIVYMVLPLFNRVVSKNIALDFSDPALLFGCIGIVVVAGIAAGSYPAFFLSSYKPSSVLKGSASAGLRGSTLRKSLVVFQFTLTVIMVASAIVVQRQIEYIRNKELGYDRKGLINFTAVGDIRKNFSAFRIEAEKIPGVQIVTRSDNSLVQVNNQNRSVDWPGRQEGDNPFFRALLVDYGFFEAMGVKLKEGRFFSQGVADTSSFVVSERAVDVMGLENPLGTKISQWGKQGTIVGVVEDIHARSMHEAIDPLVFVFNPDWPSRVIIRYEASRTREVVEALESLVKRFAPEYPFNYTFVDDDFERLYRNEKVVSALAFGFTIIAIIISGLGLLALAAYTAERKRKEISIRKTLGASVGTLVSLMATDFARLSLIAAVLGCPTAWWLMDLFLQGYAYHTELSIGIFIATALAVVMISLATVMFQVARAAVANPVDALRNE